MSAFLWFLMILSFPETARNVVGNGSVAGSIAHKAPLTSMRPNACVLRRHKPRDRFYLSILNPLPSLQVLLRPDSALLIVSISILYMLYTCAQTSLSTLFIEIYQISQIEAGLIFLPFGVGCAVTALFTGVPLLVYYHALDLTAGRETVGQRL